MKKSRTQLGSASEAGELQSRPPAGAPAQDVAASESAPRHTVTTPEERYRLIAEAAYRRAEQRGFAGGDPVMDWLEAEREIDGRRSADAATARSGNRRRGASPAGSA